MINWLPKKYETKVNESSFSSEELKLLVIARALLKRDAKVFLFDQILYEIQDKKVIIQNIQKNLLLNSKTFIVFNSV